MENINTIRDEKTGRFQTTTDTTRYKMVQFNNRIMSKHARAVCLALNIPFIPKGFIVHHLDENKKNNEIDNLALVTITAHNRIHAHEAWNKGISPTENTIFKQRIAREKGYLIKFKEAYELYLSGKNYNQISKIIGVGRGTAGMRVRRYQELTNKYDK